MVELGYTVVFGGIGLLVVLALAWYLVLRPLLVVLVAIQHGRDINRDRRQAAATAVQADETKRREQPWRDIAARRAEREAELQRAIARTNRDVVD